MGAQKFQYDESGGTFFYFLLSFLALILIPATVYYWPRKQKEDPERIKKQCHCLECVKKRELMKAAEPWKGPKNLFIKFIIVLGWTILILIAYKVSQFDYEMANFDPYEILKVPVGSSQSEIKKAYRKLSVILHPDKETGNEKEFMKLSKAYQALTDEEAKKNFEKYGNPDGPGAMSFGIALPSWIVEKENSVWVLGLYALVFMVALPIVVGTWWYRSIRFSGDQVLLDTSQMYYYYLHKTPNITLKRVIMILAASFEFDRKFNSEVVVRPSDDEEVPQLTKKLTYLGEKNKEKPLCFPYSIKARALIHAHLFRIPLNPLTLEQDRRFIVAKCPYLIQEMIHCVNQLILLGYARRVQQLLGIESIEHCMKLCPMIIQGIWEFKSPFLQLPHITEDILKYFMTRKRPIKSLQQFAQLKGEDRRNILRHLTDEQYDDVMKVLGSMPYVDFQFRCEVIDDENPNEVTAGAIITVTVTLVRKDMSTLFGDETIEDKNICNENTLESDLKENETENNTKHVNKRPIWAKQKKSGGKKSNKKGNKQKSKGGKAKADDSPAPVKEKNDEEKEKTKEEKEKKPKEEKEKKPKEERKQAKVDDSDDSDSDVEINDASSDEEAKTNVEDDDQEWEKFQQKVPNRDKVLEGRSKMSHSVVHCPYFPNDKQEYWWTYICCKKSKTLLAQPYHITSLVDKEECHLRFTAPTWKGLYTFQVCLRSDCYIGFDQQKDIKIDVKPAPAEITEHPQWVFDNSEEEDLLEDSARDSEYTTDDLPEDGN